MKDDKRFILEKRETWPSWLKDICAASANSHGQVNTFIGIKKKCRNKRHFSFDFQKQEYIESK